jgi:CMP-N,N'-diacetyllegionaminic acid synthase
MIIYVPIKELSQRVPNKNFRKLGKESLYIRCLKKLKNYKVFIDTDSEKIIETIKSDNTLNHVVPFKRSKSLEGHEVSVCDLIEDFIKRFSIVNKTICQLHVTSPFLKEDTITSASLKLDEKISSVVSCNIYQSRLWRKEEYGYCPVNHNPTKLEQTQDLPAFYEENSLFYIFNSDEFIRSKLRVSNNPYFYPCSFPENLDIDTEEDWNLCESLIKTGVIQ